MTVMLVNPFTVFEGKEEAFLSLWDRTNGILQDKPGYVSVRLLKALDAQPNDWSAAFTHVNVAEWASPELYEEAIKDPEIAGLTANYKDVSSFAPALYAVLRETTVFPAG